MKIMFLIIGVIAGCAPVLSTLDVGGTEVVDGEFYDVLIKSTTRGWAPTTYNTDVAHAYHFVLDKPRFVRYMYLQTLGPPVKNVDVYTRRTSTDTWKRIKQIKSPVDETTRIDLNIRVDAIRVIPRTIVFRGIKSWGVISGFIVYAQKEGHKEVENF